MRTMAAKSNGGPAAKKRYASDIIDAVVDNMRENIEPLKYTLLAPSRYIVYLHPAEYARLEGIIPEIRSETIQALNEALTKMNAPSRVARIVRRLSQSSTAPARVAASTWEVDILPDADGELEEGSILIDSILVLPARPELGVGERTRVVRTRRREGTSTVETPSEEAPGPSTAATVLARISYTDGSRTVTFEMKKDSITIGRGGRIFPVDLKIQSTEDVSREHARIRRDPRTGEFFIVDLSKLGTTIDGNPVPKGYELMGETKRENGAESILPPQAMIGLADTVMLTFSRVQ
jgi:hypothetical protein